MAGLLWDQFGAGQTFLVSGAFTMIALCLLLVLPVAHAAERRDAG